MKTNNPANIISAKAKKAGLSYWQYMAQEYPGRVQAYVWPTKAKKLTRAERLEKANNQMRGRMGLKFMAGIRDLVSGRGVLA